MSPLHARGTHRQQRLGPQVMHAAGFRVVGDAVVLQPEASLPALTCLLARLRRIACQRGHSGDAKFFPLPSSSGARGPDIASPYLVSRLTAVVTSRILLSWQLPIVPVLRAHVL